MNIFIRLLVSALAVAITAYLLPGISVDGAVPLLVTVVVLGIVNIFVKPVLIVLTLPINIFTLGLFTLVINAILILLTDWLVSGFDVASFWWALAFSLLLSIVSSFLSLVSRD